MVHVVRMGEVKIIEIEARHWYAGNISRASTAVTIALSQIIVSVKVCIDNS